MPKVNGKYDSAFREQMLVKIRGVLALEGYVLRAEEYVNNRTKLDILCPGGHPWMASWDTIRANKRCPYCYKLGVGKARLNKKKVAVGWVEHRQNMYMKFKEQLQKEGYTVHSTAYENNRHKWQVTCSRGHGWSTSWNSWSNGKRCRHCWIEDSRLTQDHVASILAADGCLLLGEYKGVDQSFKYVCSCGRMSYIRLHDYRQGHRCSACGALRGKVTLRQKRIQQLMQYSGS